MRHRATLDVAGVSRRYIEEIELGLHPLLRLSIPQRYRRICLVPDVSATRSSCRFSRL